MSDDDKRKWPRMALALDVKMRFDNLDQAVEAETANISREGLFIAMETPKPLGTKVRARVDIAGSGESFVLEGVVVHAVPDPDDPDAPPPEEGPPGVGVFLTSATEGWARFCEDLLSRKAGGDDFGAEDTRPDRMPVVVEKVRRTDQDE